MPLSLEAEQEYLRAQCCSPDNVQYLARADGEIIGSLILLSRDSGTQMSDVDQKVAETTANIVGRQMEQ